TLSGTVADQNGAVVANAAITVADPAKGLKRNVTTNSEGQFTVPLLPPGTYTVTVSQDGFGTVQVNDLVLNVADNRSLNIQLKVGDISGVVNVEASAVAVRTEGSVATVIDRTFVGNLPLNGRSFSSLVLLTPGVTIATSGAASQDAGQFSVNGQRASTNYFTVDGAGANFGIGAIAKSLQVSGSYPATGITGGTSNLVSIDALEEFKIQTSTYTAESGRQPGGQVQIVTRSGKNQFHGLLFEYFRNEALVSCPNGS
ncbi:MAG TPA: carboxypeptidase-like regulatory domain-containing protein, partial [Pyrinomonadaceae bacterium]|nr:carboxypeptidase-like regulatory domain-containing protein [Pyrinomonadaceae bacterium]